MVRIMLRLTIEIEQPAKPLEWNFEVTSEAASKKKKKARLTWSFEVTEPSEIPPKSTTSSTPHHAGPNPKKQAKPMACPTVTVKAQLTLASTWNCLLQWFMLVCFKKLLVRDL